VFVANLQISAQYRVNMGVWAASGLIQIAIYLSIWSAVARASGGSSHGYTGAQFAGYFLVLLVVRDLTFTWVPWHFPDRIRTGDLSPFLLRPQHPLVYEAGDIFAYRLQGTLLLVPVTAVLFLLSAARTNATPAAVLCAMALIPLASLLRFLLDSTIAVFGFWVVRIDGLRGVYIMVMLLTNGQFAPIAQYPAWLRSVAHALPFWWTLGYPVELAVGRQPVSSVPHALAVLATWVVVAWIGLRMLWRRGVARYGAVGA
jgi:ABC-2 type transport system permease protein